MMDAANSALPTIDKGVHNFVWFGQLALPFGRAGSLSSSAPSEAEVAAAIAPGGLDRSPGGGVQIIGPKAAKRPP